MDPGERASGTRDEHYNLISVLYNALHGTENCNTYALDAEATGDQRLANFFREAGKMQARLAEQTKGMLGIDSAPTTLPEEIAPPDTPALRAGSSRLEREVFYRTRANPRPWSSLGSLGSFCPSPPSYRGDIHPR
jgi:hypothetical protein